MKSGPSQTELQVSANPRASASALVIQMILAQFYQRDETPEVRAMEVASWLRVLRGRSAEKIMLGWEEYQRHSPRQHNGNLRKPTAHEIGSRIASTEPTPPVIRVADERMKRMASLIKSGGNVSMYWITGPGARDLLASGLASQVEIDEARKNHRSPLARI